MTVCEKSRTTGIRFPDNPAHSESLWWLSYPGPHLSVQSNMLNKYLEFYADKMEQNHLPPQANVHFSYDMCRGSNHSMSVYVPVFSWSALELLHISLCCLFFCGGWWLRLTCNVLTWSCSRLLMQTSVLLMTTNFLTSYHDAREHSLYKRNTSYSELLLTDCIFHLLILRKRLPVPAVVSRDSQQNWCSDGRLFYNNPVKFVHRVA